MFKQMTNWNTLNLTPEELGVSKLAKFHADVLVHQLPIAKVLWIMDLHQNMLLKLLLDVCNFMKAFQEISNLSTMIHYVVTGKIE